MKHVITMAHRLGARVVAEGVETEAEFHVCRDLGCDLLQGCYVAMPTVCHVDLEPTYPHLLQADDTRQGTASADRVLIRRQVEHLPTVREDASLETIFELFRTSPEQAFFPVLNADDEPRGVIHEHHLKNMIYHPFGRELLKNRFHERRVASLVTPAPVADINMPADGMIEIFAGANSSEKQLTSARDQNPLSELPGNRAIRDHVHEAMQDGDRTASSATATSTISSRSTTSTAFTGAMPPSPFSRTFLAGTSSERVISSDMSAATTFRRPVEPAGGRNPVGAPASAFSLQARGRGALSEADRRRGFITGRGRSGIGQSYLLMRSSVGVLVLEEGAILTEVNAVTARVAELKASQRPASPDWSSPA